MNDEVWLDSAKKRWVKPHQRSVGYVFQEGSLFPHLTVRGNLNYALSRSRSTKKAAWMEEVSYMLGVEKLLDRSPRKLSGGERQRVAIARSLLVDPKLLLLDEPISALDTQSRSEVLPYLERLKREAKLPIIYVSHSVEEVRRLADHIVMLDQGKVRSAGTKNDVFWQTGGGGPPVVSFVAESGTGKTTLIEAIIRELKGKGYRIGAIKHDAHEFEIDYPGKDSFRFTHAGADTTVISSNTKLGVVARPESPLSVEEIGTRYFADCDLVLAEGYKKSTLPKVIVFRDGFKGILESKLGGEVIAFVGDTTVQAEVPVLELNQPGTVARFLESKFLTQKEGRRRAAQEAGFVDG